jgi:hypothetical protein
MSVQDHVRAHKCRQPLVRKTGLILVGLVPFFELWYRIFDLLAVPTLNGLRREPRVPIAVPFNFLVRIALRVGTDGLRRPEGATIPLLERSKDPGQILPAVLEGVVQEVKDEAANLGVADDTVIARSSITTHGGNGIALEGVENLRNARRHSLRGSFVQSALELACLNAMFVEVLESFVGVPEASMRKRPSFRQEGDLPKILAHFSRVVAIAIHNSIEHHAANVVREHRGERGA